MDTLKERELIELAPVFLRDMYGDEMHSCMHYGICCEDGWFEIMKEACQAIEKLNTALAGQGVIYASQIKEKFGDLNIYYDVEGDVPEDVRKKVREIILKANQDSWETCEICGEPATHTTSGYIQRLCETCYNKRKEAKLDAKKED